MTQKTCIKTYFQFFDKDGIYEKDLFTLTHFFLYSILCLHFSCMTTYRAFLRQIIYSALC